MSEEPNVTHYEFYFAIAAQYLPLFENTKFVWDALSRLPAFLEHTRQSGMTSLDAYVDPTAFVHPSAIVSGSYVGPDAKIYEGAVVRDSLIGAATVIGHASEIARSIILDKVSVPRFDYIGASIIGTGVRVGGMVAFASRRFDGENVGVRIKGQLYQTRFRKLGSIIGDNSMVGFGVHCNPGTMVGPNTLIMPQVELQGFVPADSLVVVNQRMKIVRKQSLSGLVAALDDGDD